MHVAPKSFAHTSQKSSEILNDCISRNGRRIKSTEPNLIILVSFSFAEDALSNDVKIYTTFRMQDTENPPFRFLGTPGIVYMHSGCYFFLHF